MKWFIGFITLILSTGLVAQTTAISVIENPVVSNLEEIQEIMANRPDVIDYQFANVNLNSLQNETSIRIKFGDVDIVLDRDKLKKRSENNFTWFGVDGEELLSVVITVIDNNIMGSISSPTLSYSIETFDGTVVLVKIDQSKYPIESCSGFSGAASTRSDVERIESEEEDEGDTGINASFYGCKLRVLVMYTPKARDKSNLNMYTLAQNAVDNLDFAFFNSNINQEVELVFVGKVDYSESTDMEIDLRMFRNKNDNIMDDVHSYREKYGADICVLILDNSTHIKKWCGQAAALRTSSDQAFAVVHHSCILAAKSFEHEVGHLYGAQHAVGDAGVDVALEIDAPYAHGYKDPNGYFRTIMAYNCPSGCFRAAKFSDPNSSNGPFPYGDADSYNRKMIVQNMERMMYLRRTGYIRYITSSDVNIVLVKSLYSSGFIRTIGQVVIQTGSDYRFVAEESVLLQTGFEVEGEAQFEALVSSCGEEGTGRLDYNPLSDEFFKNSIKDNNDFVKGKPQLYPNPVKDYVSIVDITLTDLNGGITIYSASGKVLVVKNDVKLGIPIPVGHLPIGVYFLKFLSENNEVKVFKFIKK